MILNYYIYNIKRFEMISLKNTRCCFVWARYLHWLTGGLGGPRDDALELAVARIQTCAGEQTVVYLAGFGQRNEEIGMLITFLPKCEFVENEHLSPSPAQETERTDGRRASGRSSGAGRRKD